MQIFEIFKDKRSKRGVLKIWQNIGKFRRDQGICHGSGLIFLIIFSYIASPIAWAIGIKQCRKKQVNPVPVLEDYLKSHRYVAPDEGTLKDLCKSCGMLIFQIISTTQTIIWGP